MRKLSVGLALVVALCVVSGWSSSAGEPKDDPAAKASLHRRLGDTYCREKKYPEAEKEYRKALALTKDALGKVRIYELLSDVARRQDNKKKCLAYLRKAQIVSRAHRDVRNRLTERVISELIRYKDFKAAEKEARSALKTGRTEHEKLSFWNHICNIHRQQKTLEKLETEAKAAVKKRQSLTNYRMLKAVYELMGDAPKLKALNKQIASSFPQATAARWDHVQELVRQGQMKAAVPILEKLASSPGPNRRKAAQALADHYFRARKDREARKWLASFKSPTTETYRRVIRMLLAAKRHDRAYQEYDEAIANADAVNDHFELRLEKARLLEKTGKKADALKEYVPLARIPIVPKYVAEQAVAAVKRLKGDGKKTR